MKQRILIIEDNEQNLYLVTFLLEKHGYEVVAARNGPDGIRLAEEIKPALILLDIQLPDMDGFEVLDRLREKSILSRVPIVAVTSHAMAGDRESIMKAGCTGYIKKPINPDTFLTELEQFLQSNDDEREGP